MGVHESIIPAAAGPMVARARRASAYGLFTSLYGVSWFLGSAVIGFLYERSMVEAVVFCIAIELVSLPVLALTARVADKRAAVSQ